MPDLDPNDIDEVIHGRVRLSIMAFLSTAGQAEFGVLKDKTQATDGNLSTHLRKLEDAGYVVQDKRFVGRKPQTVIGMTELGRKAFVNYLTALQALLPAKGSLT